MEVLDWWIVGLYLLGLIGMSAWLARGQTTGRDYYLAGNKTGPFPIALSTVATQCSTNSLLGAPAFVAFAAGGGLVWLQYELAVPLAMIVLILVIFPVFRRLELISVYDYLERRFGVRTRVTLSLVFQLTRAFSTGVTIYGITLVVQMILGLPFWAAVLVLGVVTIIYDVLGGMRAVIWSDVLQVIILWGGILLAIAFALPLVGGFAGVLDLVPAERLTIIDMETTGFGDGLYGFWPMLIGGLFLYVGYYGCDQTQAQRELSTRSLDDTSKALMYDGLLRLPLVLTYCFFGVCLAAYATVDPGFLNTLPPGSDGSPDLNTAGPVFILQTLPTGVKGLIIAGLFAAAMSSLDSTINALSALSMEDLFKRFRKKALTPRQEMRIGKGFTMFWGLVTVACSFVAGGIADTVIESVNLVSSVLMGPLLCVFVLGMTTRRVGGQAVIFGLFTGLAINLGVHFGPVEIAWIWLNVIGFGATLVAAFAWTLLRSPLTHAVDPRLLWHGGDTDAAASRANLRRVGILFAYAMAMIIAFALMSVAS